MIDTSFRTIPTGAGKTNDQDYQPMNHSDHPHGRGENFGSSAEICVLIGPSPRARGKLENLLSPLADARTIPTGAGKTSNIDHYAGSASDHPHGRGENFSNPSIHRNKFGPSPRARGKPQKIGDKKTHHTISCDLSIVKELRLKFSRLLPI